MKNTQPAQAEDANYVAEVPGRMKYFDADQQRAYDNGVRHGRMMPPLYGTEATPPSPAADYEQIELDYMNGKIGFIQALKLVASSSLPSEPLRRDKELVDYAYKHGGIDAGKLAQFVKTVPTAPVPAPVVIPLDHPSYVEDQWMRGVYGMQMAIRALKQTNGE